MGSIYPYAGNFIKGWILNKNNFKAHVFFDLYIDKELKGRYVANKSRRHLREKGLGTGEYGFDVPASPSWNIRGGTILTIRPVGYDDFELVHRVVDSEKPSEAEVAKPKIARDAIPVSEAPPPPQPAPTEETKAPEPVPPRAAPSSPAAIPAPEPPAAKSPAAAPKVPPPPPAPVKEKAPVKEPPSINEPAPVKEPPSKDAPRQTKEQPAPAPLTTKAILDYVKSLSDSDVNSIVQEIQNNILFSRARTYFSAKQWGELSELRSGIFNGSENYSKLLTLIGRGAIYKKDYALAKSVLFLGAEIFTESPDVLFYCGVAHMRADEHMKAVSFLRAALARDKSIKVKKELAEALQRAGRGIDALDERRSYEDEALDFYRQILEAEYSPRVAMTMGKLFYNQDRFTHAVAVADQILEIDADHIEALLLKSRSLVGLNRVKEALQISERVAALDPLNQTARFHLRSLRTLAEDSALVAPPTFGELRITAGGLRFRAAGEAPRQLEPATARNAVLAQVAGLPVEWLCLVPDAARPLDDAALAALEPLVDPWCGFVEVPQGRQEPLRLWRRDALVNLLESGLVDGDLAALGRFEAIYAAPPRAPLEGVAATAVVLSRHGSFKFGGGEQFIESMAEHYQSVGYDPIILGTRPEFQGQSGETDLGFRFSFVANDAAALRRFFLENDSRLVHVISGLGFAVAEALNHTNIPFIYGVHFWREALGSDSDKDFFDENGAPRPRHEFRYILSRAATVYANSEYTRDVLEQAFGVRCPVVFSVPREIEA